MFHRHLSPTNIHFRSIDNVGSCDYVYLWHIIHVINGNDDSNNSDVSLFIKDTSVIHSSNNVRKANDCNLSRIKKFLNRLQNPKKISKSYDCFFNVYDMGHMNWKDLSNFRLDNWDFTASKSKMKYMKSNLRPYGKWFCHNLHLRDYIDCESSTVPVALGGLFAVTTRRIRRVHLDVWKSLLQDIGTSANNEQCHYMERTYGILFKSLPTLYKTTDIVIVSAHITGKVNTHEGSLEYTSRYFCKGMTDLDINWCPHLMYTDDVVIGKLAKSLGWIVIMVTDTNNLTLHKETNLYAKRYKMKPHTLDEVIARDPHTVVWMDSSRCIADRTPILDTIDSFEMSSKFCIVGMHNFCGGGMRGNVYDEFYESIEANTRYSSDEHLFKKFINVNKRFFSEIDKEGMFMWCTNLIYNLRDPMCQIILDEWYNITMNTQIIQDQITMHFVHQKYRKHIGLSPVQLYKGYIDRRFHVNTKNLIKNTL